nr:uncharacterized protein K02A2.6-like [Aedes albopictus]
MYLRGLDFSILTDHKPLIHIFSESSCPNKRQERWVLRMQSYRYSIKHVPGEVNIADPLSRLCETVDAKTYDKWSEDALYSIAEVNIPSAITMTEVIRSSQNDPEFEKVKKALNDDQWSDLKAYAPFKSELCFSKDLLLRRDEIVVPGDLREAVVRLSHSGHPGKEKTKRRLRTAVWWPGLDSDVEKACRSCVECQMVGPVNKPEPLRIREIPSAPWVHVSADFLGPLPNGKYIFVLVDLYSRFVVAEFMSRTLSADVIRVLRQIFTKMGLPFVLTTDNAKNFSSQELKDYCVDYGILGYGIKDLFPHVQDEATFDDEMRDRDATVKYRAKEYRDKKVGAKETTINVGDEVLMKNMQPANKLTPTFLPVPATVVEKWEVWQQWRPRADSGSSEIHHISRHTTHLLQLNLWTFRDRFPVSQLRLQNPLTNITADLVEVCRYLSVLKITV